MVPGANAHKSIAALARRAFVFVTFDFVSTLDLQNLALTRISVLRGSRDRGVALVRPYPRNREIAKSKLRNREIGIKESWNRKIAKSRNQGIAKSRNRDIANWNRKSKSETCHVSSNRKSRFGIGNRDLESEIEIGIGNRELEIGNRIANMPRQIRWWPSSEYF